MVGAAVNVTASPAQIVELVDVIFTEAGTEAETIIVIVFDVSVIGDAHNAFEVIITVTKSPFTNEDEVKVDEVAPPTFTPLTCHW